MIMKKICKECGKEFEATDGRQKYCNRQHFRPCPVCGKIIEVTHLSNPTPKCSECGKHRIRKPKPTQFSLFSFDPKPDTDTIKSDVSAPRPSVSKEIDAEDKTKVVSNTKSSRTNAALNIHSDEYVTRKYTGRTTCGFTHNHIYTVGLVSNNPYGYIVHAILDQTVNDDINIGLNISSENSWKYFFKVV